MKTYPTITTQLTFREQSEKEAFREALRRYKEEEGIYYDQRAIIHAVNDYWRLYDELMPLRKQYNMLMQQYYEVTKRMNRAEDELARLKGAQRA